MGDSYGAAIVEHLSRDDLLQTDFEPRDGKGERQPLYAMGVSYTPKNEGLGSVPTRDRSLDNDDDKNDDKEKFFDENISNDKPPLTETTF